MKKTVLHVCLIVFFLATLTAFSSAQLTNTATSENFGCSGYTPPRPNNTTVYSNWAYTDSHGTKHSFSGSDYVEVEEEWYEYPREAPITCGENITTSFDAFSTDNLFYLEAGGASGSVGGAGILYPKFKVLSIVYASPGNESSDGYTDTLTDGTTTSVGSSFSVGDTITFSESFGFLGLGSTMSWSFGTAVTTGSSTAVTDTFSEATGVSNDSNAGASNAINHGNDLFIIWLNPAVKLAQTGTTTAIYSEGTQLQTSGDPDPGQSEAVDSLEVYAGVMKANASGVTTVPAAILNAQTVSVAGETGSQTLPGLGSICASHPYYPSSCTLANQCGCVPADFAGILATDPLLNFTNTESPLNANTSSNPDRFVEITGAELLSGPEEKGGNNPVNSFTESDSTQTAETWTYSLAYTAGYSWGVSWVVLGTGPSLTSATQFTWTNTDSVGESNGSAHTEAVSLSSDTVGCYEDVSIFEDTVFHTFAFEQPTGNTSCP
jgi:hypothetical protein